MWFVVSIVCIALLALVGAKFKNTAKQKQGEDYNRKVKKLNEAKEILSTNKRLASSYHRLVDIYSNESLVNKSEKTNVVMQIMKQTSDSQIATAICALAKMESNRRLNKNVTKS